jgi:hypothetical protein
MAAMSSTKGAAAWPEGTLPAILEPWIRVTITGPAMGWGGQVIQVAGYVKGPETVGDTGADIDALVGRSHQRFTDGLARATRETMYRQAEEAIEAALEAGWVLAGHPEIRVGGTVNRDRDTGVDVPMAEVGVALHFRAPSPPDQE